jgi:beta-lactamase class A
MRSLDVISVNEHETFPSASLIKLLPLVELYRQAAEGRLSLAERLTVLPQQRVGGSGVLKELDPGHDLTLKETATLMVILSDNTATNMLVDRLGLDAINRTSRELRLEDTEMRYRVDFEHLMPDISRFGVATPNGIVRLLEAVVSHEIMDQAHSEGVIDIMERQQYQDMIPRHIPWNMYARDLGVDQEVWVANKTGFFMGVRTDGGIVTTPKGRYVVALLSKECTDVRFTPDNEATLALAQISKIIFDYHTT